MLTDAIAAACSGTLYVYSTSALRFVVCIFCVGYVVDPTTTYLCQYPYLLTDYVHKHTHTEGHCVKRCFKRAVLWLCSNQILWYRSTLILFFATHFTDSNVCTVAELKHASFSGCQV